MRKPDIEVREVLCSETGKPMPKIPLWMADIKVKFVCDEARQKNPAVPGLMDIESTRKTLSASSELDELKEVDAAGVILDEDGEDYEEEIDDAVEDDYEA